MGPDLARERVDPAIVLPETAGTNLPPMVHEAAPVVSRDGVQAVQTESVAGDTARRSAARRRIIHALTRVLHAVCFAPLLVLPTGIVMQRIVALQRPALH